MTYAQGMTKATPKVGKMKKIIHKAAQAGSLIGEALIEDIGGDSYNLDIELDEDQGLASTSKCASIGRCAMGELLFAIGYSNKELRMFNGSGDWNQDVYQELREGKAVSVRI